MLETEDIFVNHIKLLMTILGPCKPVLICLQLWYHQSLIQLIYRVEAAPAHAEQAAGTEVRVEAAPEQAEEADVVSVEGDEHAEVVEQDVPVVSDDKTDITVSFDKAVKC